MAITSWSKAARSRWRAAASVSEFIVAAAEVLHKRMSGCQDPRGPMAFDSAHRPQPRYQPPVIGLGPLTPPPDYL
jgi:hypothetical protein